MIHWDYIKGLNDTGNSYTIVKFPTTNVNLATGEYKTLPTIYTTGSSNDPYLQKAETNKIDFGKILTSYDYIELEKKKNSDLELILRATTTNGTEDGYFKITNRCRWNTIPFSIKLANNEINFNGYVYANQGMNVSWYDTNSTSEEKECLISTSISVLGGDDKKTKYGLTTDGIIKTSNKCEALYLNTTSDQRAKKNFTHVLKTDALSWINNLEIYTFDYYDNNKSIGITAQQVQDKPVNDFNFVDNLKATGENGDYMTIKESKLVYMCMSAIQELSQQNKALQEKLVTLEDELKKLRK